MLLISALTKASPFCLDKRCVLCQTHRARTRPIDDIFYIKKTVSLWIVIFDISKAHAIFGKDILSHPYLLMTNETVFISKILFLYLMEIEILLTSSLISCALFL